MKQEVNFLYGRPKKSKCMDKLSDEVNIHSSKYIHIV